MKNIMRLITVFAILLSGSSSTFAQSTVYVFMRSVPQGEGTIRINGGSPINILGPEKTKFSFSGFYHPSKTKCLLKDEGKYLINACYIFYTPSDKRKMEAEIQLNLTEGSVHYLKIGYKGMNDIQIEEVDEKEGKKLLKDKKYIEMPEYIEE